MRVVPLAGWVTITVAVSIDPDVVVTVIVAVRAAPVFVVADIVTDRVPEPVAGLIVTQDASEVACQLALEVTKRVPEVADEVGIAHSGMDSDSVDPDVEVPGWVTAMVWVTGVPPEVVVNVTVAVLAEVDVFVAACSITEPLPDPDDGLTVSHVALDDALQVVFDVTETDVDPAFAEPTVHDDIDSVSDGVTTVTPGCVTATVRVTAVPPEVVVAVMVAVLAEVDVLAAACNITEPLPDPEVGLTVSHVALDDALQVVFDVTVTDVESEFAEPTVHEDIDSVNDGVTTVVPGWFTVTVAVAGEPDVVVKVIVAVRAGPVFAVADMVIDWVPDDPDVMLSVAQLASDVPCQVVLEVTKRNAEVADEVGIDHTGTDTDNVDADEDAPGWVTATVRETALPSEVVVTVTVADLAEVVVFAAACNVKAPFPVPDVGLTVSHVALDDALQVVFDVTVTDVEPALDEPTGHDDIDRVNDGVTAEDGWLI
ncbi:MAG: hypothetical protein FWD80_03840, partial [Propionibacteriaceae bacterium]|nr:hypothetical protein [Propionibacteriaceae bacterium]